MKKLHLNSPKPVFTFHIQLYKNIILEILPMSKRIG